MDEETFLTSLEGLTGKTAIVTGGTQGIGLQTTVYLASLGAKVYVCALDTLKDRAGLATAETALAKYSASHECHGSIHFHSLDLSSISSTKSSAEKLKQKFERDGESRIDILVCNAGIMFSPQTELSGDGFEKTWLSIAWDILYIIERTAARQGEARIVTTSSEGYKLAAKLDYDALSTAIPNDGTSMFHLWRSFQRYCNSKLGVIYLALELDRRLRERGVEGVRVNACHPGRAPSTEIGDFQQTFMSPAANRWLKWIITLGYNVGNTVEDCAKTQTFLSASQRVRRENVRGQYWVPKINWWLRYAGCQKEDLSMLGRDEGKARRMWEFCEEAVRKTQAPQ